MKTERISIRGVKVDDVDMNEALDICESFLCDGKVRTVFTPNSEIVQMCVEDESLKQVLNSSDLIIPDGEGVILASKLLKTPLKKGKVAGIELFEKLLGICEQRKIPAFLLGGKPGVAEKAAEKLKEKYPSLEIAGTNDGYFEKSGEQSDSVIEKLKASGAGFVAVCLGAPTQEKWISSNREKLGPALYGGFGGSLDVFSGGVRRAPKLMIKLRLEWLYRLVKEPKRIGRMMKIPKLLLGCVFSKKVKKA